MGYYILLIRKTTFEPVHEKSVNITQATNKGSGEPAHKWILTRVFAIRRLVVGTLRRLQAKMRVFDSINELSIYI